MHAQEDGMGVEGLDDSDGRPSNRRKQSEMLDTPRAVRVTAHDLDAVNLSSLAGFPLALVTIALFSSKIEISD